ncbi:MAG TPA: type II toxin-antitoxin system HicB family antitoxin [Chthoniobacteraceae bacterium]|jgi:predicted RNase H-like HicB family nuclease|nr:type II toxin-antitoxin system HicB family antitoxin [Chthoniobacteraceae bacterium]
MLSQYIEAAMRHAHYETMENGRFWGDIPPCAGCWGDGDTLEECRENLRGALESWILAMVEHDARLPVINGLDFNPWKSAETEQMAPREDGRHPAMFKDGTVLIIPDADCEEVDWTLMKRILAQAEIDPADWEELGSP